MSQGSQSHPEAGAVHLPEKPARTVRGEVDCQGRFLNRISHLTVAGLLGGEWQPSPQQGAAASPCRSDHRAGVLRWWGGASSREGLPRGPRSQLPHFAWLVASARAQGEDLPLVPSLRRLKSSRVRHFFVGHRWTVGNLRDPRQPAKQVHLPSLSSGYAS